MPDGDNQLEVRHFFLCDDVRPDPKNLHRLDIRGLIVKIRSSARPPFPLSGQTFSVLSIMTHGHGSGKLQPRISDESSGTVIFRSVPRQVRFVGDPQAVLGIVFRVRNCTFPRTGLYWVELVYSA